MTALLMQSGLKAAFEAAMSGRAQSRPGDRERIEDILVRFGRIDPAGAARLVAAAQKHGRSLAWAAARLKLLPPEDAHAAAAIERGYLRGVEAAFSLSPEIVLFRRPASPEAERFRHLRTRLMTTFAPERLAGLAIAPASASARAGYVAANLGAAFAQLKKRVLIIDADLRRPTIARLFAAKTAHGLEEALVGRLAISAAIAETPVAGLCVLAAARPIDDPQALLAGAAFGEMMEAARSAFDIVLVLTAAYGPVADGQFAWAGTKTAIVVARRGETRSEELKGLNAVLRQVGADVAGAVLTD